MYKTQLRQRLHSSFPSGCAVFPDMLRGFINQGVNTQGKKKLDAKKKQSMVKINKHYWQYTRIFNATFWDAHEDLIKVLASVLAGFGIQYSDSYVILASA